MRMRFRKLLPCLIALILGAVSVPAQGPTLVFKGTDGSQVSGAALKGKVVVLCFGATWVPMSAKQLPAIQKLAASYPDAKVFWISVNPSRQGAANSMNDADLAAYASRNGLKIPVLRDAERSAYKTLGLNSLPTTVVLDKDGVVKSKYEGFDPDQADPFSEVAQMISSLLK